MDRDTLGLSGTPDIAMSIFAKIASADIFVADVSIVNHQDGGRPTPNPNVLFELGFAVAELGWDNVVLVMNEFFGDPSVLPFDLRGRRIIVYRVSPEEEKAEARGLLQGRLETSIRIQLGTGEQGALPSGPDADLWWGQWNVSDHGAHGGRLFISEVGPDGFLFDLNTFNGAHVGSLQGAARIVSRDLAYARIPGGNSEGDGELVFRRSRRSGDRVIEIDESTSCSNFHGLQGYFAETYRNRPEPWFEAGVMTELDLSRLHSLVGDHLERLRQGARLQVEETYDTTGKIKIITGGAPGLYTTMESIVIVGEHSRMCCAYIDEDVVRYFSNRQDWIEQVPGAFDDWRTNFLDKQVVVESFRHQQLA